MKLALVIVTQLLIAANAFASYGACVLPGRGHFQIHVGTAGLFGALAHNHLIEAEKERSQVVRRKSNGHMCPRIVGCPRA